MPRRFDGVLAGTDGVHRISTRPVRRASVPHQYASAARQHETSVSLSPRRRRDGMSTSTLLGRRRRAVAEHQSVSRLDAIEQASRRVSAAKFDSCAASRGEEERGELAAHCRCCCVVYARVTFAASMRRVVAPLDAFASLFNCSTLRAPAASGRTRVALLAAVLQAVCSCCRALNRSFRCAYKSREASARRQCSQAHAQRGG